MHLCLDLGGFELYKAAQAPLSRKITSNGEADLAYLAEPDSTKVTADLHHLSTLRNIEDKWDVHSCFAWTSTNPKFNPDL